MRHDSATANGDSCSLCSSTAPETNTNTKTEVENESPHRDWLGYAIAFVLGALTASAIFAVVLLIKRKGTK